MKKIFIYSLLIILFGYNSYSQNCSISLTTYSYSSGGYNYLRSGDYNNDGKEDLLSAYTSFTNCYYYCYLQTTPNNFSIITNTCSGRFIGSADLNNDGKIDFLTDDTFYAGQGNGTFLPSILTPSLTLTNWPPYNGYIGDGESFLDFNNDGKLDLLVSSQLYLGVGNGNFNAPITTSAFNAGFINGDNFLDIVSFVSTTNPKQSTVTIQNGIGNGSFNAVNSFTVPEFIGTLFIKDINNDNKTDLIFNNLFTSTVGVFTMFGNGNNQFSSISTNFVATTPSTSPSHFNIEDMNNDNLPDIVVLTHTLAPFGNNVPFKLSYLHNTGSGVFNIYSTSNFTSTGNYFERLILKDLNNDNLKDIAISTYSSSSTNNVLFTNSNCVWPGDANSNGIANNSDILEIGLQFNQTGAARTSTSNIWDGYSYTAWTGSVSTGKNKAHADCNGDGTVNLNDTLAVFNNYGFMHNKNADINMVNPDISIVPDQSNVLKNTWGTASIFLGDASNNISNIHGVAFNVNYDNSLIETDSVWIEYTSSFINSNNLHFRKKVFSNGVIYTATTHTNQVNASGNGKIAILHYKIKPTLASNTVLNLSITNASKLSATAITSTLSSGTGTLNAVISNVGIKENSSSAHVAIFPNPSKGQLTIKQTDKNNFSSLITIYNSTGQIVLSKRLNSITEIVDTNLSNGIYFLVLSNSAGHIFKDKIIIE